jgi:hypothetical protein
VDYGQTGDWRDLVGRIASATSASTTVTMNEPESFLATIKCSAQTIGFATEL